MGNGLGQRRIGASLRNPTVSIAVNIVLISGLLGCTDVAKERPLLPVSTPPSPRASGPNKTIIGALECIRRSKALSKLRFAIAIHADGTGKMATGYEGATGSLLPQGTSAIWAAQAVMYAGGISINYYELNTEVALRQLGGEQLVKDLSQRMSNSRPDFILSTAFTALDFVGGPSADVRVGGIGPFAEASGASIEVSAEIYRPGDRMTLAISSLSRQVQYAQVGIGSGKFVGSNNGTLITGAISWTDQQRLQEAMRDAIALSVADVLSRVPQVPETCEAQVNALKHMPDDLDASMMTKSNTSRNKTLPKEL